jgi:alginate O-acetyltransferase complex protein AlgI
MVFTSIGFLCIFLPAFLATYYLTPARWKNLNIVLWTLLFYWLDAGIFLGFFVLSMLLNYGGGALVFHAKGRMKKFCVGLTISINVALLVWFKYATFFTESLNSLQGWWGGPLVPVIHVILPIGISFFTFQGIAYVIDIYRGTHAPARNFTEFAVFTACFPHLIAGPIVRFQDIAETIRHRIARREDFFDGFTRLAWGLFRKLVFADTLGFVADRCFSMPAAELTVPLSWLGLVCYTMQIYHDFAGYSDMAIGLGRMMGFTFPENFEQPYRAQSITEFWRRWHLSLSTWFRDYVYIPLGGNRRGLARTYLNLFIVFFLCGLWHGADWTFVLWGLYHGALLSLERLLLHRFGFQPRGLIGWAYTLLAVMVGWILFRASSPASAGHYLAALWPHAHGTPYFSAAYFLTTDRVVVLAFALSSALLPAAKIPSWIAANTIIRTLTVASAATIGYIYALSVLTANGFNPFIYFRF